MRARLPRQFSLVFVIFPVVLGAALALGGYSYRHADDAAKAAERSLVSSNTAIGNQTLDRIDNYIIDSDRSLFDLVDLEHLGDFARRFGEIVRLSPAIEAAVILDGNRNILPGAFVSKRKTADAEAFRRLLLKRILPDLPLESLTLDYHKHIHREYDGRDYLISYIKREHKGAFFYVLLKISLEYVREKLLPDVLEPLEDKVIVCVLDEHGRVVYGRPIGQPGPFLYMKGFPTTLYNWALQMAPQNAERLALEEQKRRKSEFLLITLMLAIILAGIGFSLYAIYTERRANQLKSDFISNVSHELKTPLSLIRMFGELLALGKLKSPDKAKEYADIITREAERLSRLIDNVLDFSRIERGRAAYDFQMGDLGEVVERALAYYRYRVEREGHSLVTKIDDDLPQTLLDENAMTLLLINLLENAIKYGKGEIAVYLTRVGNALRLVVGDQGPGIPQDEQKRIFERFYRTRQARGTHVRGSGIGLSLVKHIAEAHGGHVSVESEPGQGAAFIVDVPLKTQREGVAA
jgi:two-component system, OmpR family, phosphate regulon sensor histidine kinase PhoR